MISLSKQKLFKNLADIIEKTTCSDKKIILKFIICNCDIKVDKYYDNDHIIFQFNIELLKDNQLKSLKDLLFKINQRNEKNNFLFSIN